LTNFPQQETQQTKKATTQSSKHNKRKEHADEQTSPGKKSKKTEVQHKGTTEALESKNTSKIHDSDTSSCVVQTVDSAKGQSNGSESKLNSTEPITPDSKSNGSSNNNEAENGNSKSEEGIEKRLRKRSDFESPISRIKSMFPDIAMHKIEKVWEQTFNINTAVEILLAKRENTVKKQAEIERYLLNV
jgi:hypothetical protein